MSIVIGIITNKNDLHVGADKRAREGSKIISNNFQKIYRLTPSLYLGMTGIVKFVMLVKEQLTNLKNLNTLPRMDLIEKTSIIFKSFEHPVNQTSSILLAGRLENNDAFLYNISTNGNSYFKKYERNEIHYTINSTSNSPQFEQKLKDELNHPNPEFFKSIKNTIEFAATIDDSISKKCEIIKIPVK